jgi:signal transduction histidine kinase
MSPIRDHTSEIIAISAIFKDISELKKVDQLKHEFLAVISHELRTPLTPIKGYLAMLLAGQLGPLDEKQKEAITIISKQSNHLHQLIDSVIDASRIEAGKPLELENEPCFLEDLATENLEAAALALKMKEIAVTFSAPEARTALMIDRKKILRAIDNLLGNAIKFTPVRGTIALIISKSDREVVLSIRDTGIGLINEYLTKIFEPFFQVDTSYTRSSGGVGMGLAVAKDIIEAHNGKIWAESAGPGKGTTVSFSLPL